MNAATLLLATALVSQVAPSNQPASEHVTSVKRLVELLAAEQFEKAVASFDDTMKAGLPAEKLRQVWKGITAQYGSFKQIGEIRIEPQLTIIQTQFERGSLDTKVAFARDNRIAGLFFAPAVKYQSPPYVNSSAFDEIEIVVGKGPLPLSGTLSLPKGTGPFPALVLVHGSGPQDRDESIGPNKPFRDLAHGLASQGVAVLRYEKRTKQHQSAMALQAGNITVKQETVDDAAAAVETLLDHAKIDRKKIFVLGHSLGGMVLPRIDAANDKIAGLISFAGSTRPLEDLVLEQTKYIVSRGGQSIDEQKRQIDQIARQVAKVKSPELSNQTSASELPFGVPATYWLDLRGYDPAEAAKKVKQPMLILQGERDYQVTMEDYGRWQTALKGQPRVKFISYPTLNHLFVEGRGKSSPAEYSSSGNVAAQVITDIAAWLKSVK